MATAVQPSPPASKAKPRASLALSSLLGAAFVIAGVAATAYALPQFWAQYCAPVLTPLGGFANAGLRFFVQIAAVLLFARVGGALAGATAPRGIRGGITLAISAIITVFFVVRAVGLNLEGQGIAQPVTFVTLGVLLFATYQFLAAPGIQHAMGAIEDQGWLHGFSYKRSQGQKLRRYTLLGLLLIGWSGVYSMVANGSAGAGDWTLRLPFTETRLLLLPDVQYTLPIVLAGLAFWLSWRAVNVPAFADFLIATEAEMNKVSWPTRRGLTQDTIVVLVTTFLLTGYLLLVDVFWGWLLTQVNVLPTDPNAMKAPVDPSGASQSKW